MRRRSRRSLVLLAPLAALALLASCAEDEGDSNTGSATTTTAGNEKQGAFEARFEAERCDDDAPEVARCGIVAVPLDHAEPEGETIELAVAVLPSRREDTDAAPLLLLGGGPGEDLVEPLLESLDDGTSSIGALTQRRDVVLFDQRGAGESEPSLDCPDTEATLARADTSRPTSVADAGVEAAEECHEELVEDDGIDLSAFNTLQNVEDVDLVRQALDYEEIDVFGTSYGALLGLQYARDHSDVLRSLVLSSAIPPDATYIADAGTSLQRALDAVADACAADAACDRDNPDLPGTLDRLTARLAEEPEELPVGEERTVPFAPADAAAVIAGLFYLPGGVAALPSVITAIEAGDLSVLEDLALSIRAPVSMVSEGMNFSFNCSEQAPQSSAREVERRAEALSPLLRDHYVPSSPIVGPAFYDVCEVWDVDPADEALYEPVESDVPTLVVTGEFDQITPPAYGEEVAASLGRATLLEARGQGHSPLLNLGACGIGILEEFLLEPGQPLDDACVRKPITFEPLPSAG